MAVAASATLVLQRWDEPASVLRQRRTDTLQLQRMSDTHVELGASVTTQLAPSLRFGMGVANLGGAAEWRAGVKEVDRRIGSGLTWFRGRLHLGLDGQYSQADGWNVGIGTSVKASNLVELGAGYLTDRSSFRIRIGLSGLRYSLACQRDDGCGHFLGGALRF